MGRARGTENYAPLSGRTATDSDLELARLKNAISILVDQ